MVVAAVTAVLVVVVEVIWRWLWGVKVIIGYNPCPTRSAPTMALGMGKFSRDQSHSRWQPFVTEGCEGYNRAFLHHLHRHRVTCLPWPAVDDEPAIRAVIPKSLQRPSHEFMQQSDVEILETFSGLRSPSQRLWAGFEASGFKIHSPRL